MPSLNDDFPVPLQRFLPLIVGTDDEVWTRILQLDHGHERHSEAGWMALLKRRQAGASRGVE